MPTTKASLTEMLLIVEKTTIQYLLYVRTSSCCAIWERNEA
ncbi:hypothetical protein [Niallia sp. 03133]